MLNIYIYVCTNNSKRFDKSDMSTKLNFSHKNGYSTFVATNVTQSTTNIPELNGLCSMMMQDVELQ